jgi:hypothetical protein
MLAFLNTPHREMSKNVIKKSRKIGFGLFGDFVFDRYKLFGFSRRLFFFLKFKGTVFDFCGLFVVLGVGVFEPRKQECSYGL